MEKIILDTDFIIAYLLEVDSNHEKASKFLENNISYNFSLTNLVQFETANVLSRILKQDKAVELFKKIPWNELNLIWVDKGLAEEGLKIYEKEKRKNISITDCINLFLAINLKQPIASFDKFYPQEKRIQS